MNSKKIAFTTKPQNKNLTTTQLIDNWVKGEEVQSEETRPKRTTFYLPERIHKKLKIMAANKNSTMTEIIVQILDEHIK